MPAKQTTYYLGTTVLPGYYLGTYYLGTTWVLPGYLLLMENRVKTSSNEFTPWHSKKNGVSVL